jgi:hypothetical protein
MKYWIRFSMLGFQIVGLLALTHSLQGPTSSQSDLRTKK